MKKFLISAAVLAAFSFGAMAAAPVACDCTAAVEKAVADKADVVAKLSAMNTKDAKKIVAYSELDGGKWMRKVHPDATKVGELKDADLKITEAMVAAAKGKDAGKAFKFSHDGKDYMLVVVKKDDKGDVTGLAAVWEAAAATPAAAAPAATPAPAAATPAPVAATPAPAAAAPAATPAAAAPATTEKK